MFITPDNRNKVKIILKQILREWSEEGKTERKAF